MNVEMLPPTMGLRVRYADNTEGFLMLETEKPIEEIRGFTTVPLCTEPVLTMGGVTHYRTRTTLVCEEALVIAEHGEHPPRKRRQKSERYRNEPPVPGSVIGFVSVLPFTYVGIATPAPGIDVHLFEWKRAYYITINTALHLLYHGAPGGQPMTTMGRQYMRTRLYTDEGSFSIQHTDGAFDTLLLVKLLGVIPRKATTITFVRTSSIDTHLASMHSAAFELAWKVEK